MNCVNEFASSVGTRPAKLREQAGSACLQCGIGLVHFFALLRTAQDKSLNAASSCGNEALVWMTLRRRGCKDALALVGSTARRIASGKPNSGITRAQCARPQLLIEG